MIVALPTLALVAAVVGLVIVEAQVTRRDAAVAATTAVVAQTQRVQQLLIDAETGVRGYVATSDARFLQPQIDADLRLPAALRRLRSMSTDVESRSLAVDISRLAVREQRLLADLQGLGGISPSSERVTAVALRAKATMDAVRADVARLASYESQRQVDENRARRQTQRLVTWLAVVLGVVGLFGGIGGAAVLMARLIRRVIHVQRNADRLAVGEPLQPLPDAGCRNGRNRGARDSVG
jgi:CHASE3 domain sensor protein